MKNPLISVIIPVYNVQNYLSVCLDSVIKQSYHNLEIIVVDDGSSDSSGTICDTYKRIDNRIIVIHQDNKGLSGARNTGMKIAKGDYITFIDSDDFIDARYLEIMLTTIIESSADIALSGIAYCDDNGSLLYKVSVPQNTIFDNIDQLRVLLSDSRRYPTVAWAKLYKRQLFDGIFYPVNKYHEDVYTTYKVVEKSARSVAIKEVYYWYRQVSSGITHSSFQLKHLDSIDATLKRASFVDDNYPELSREAHSAIAYSACKLLEKMIIDNYHDEKIERYLLKNLRNNVFQLLQGHYRKHTKVFALTASISFRVTRAFYTIWERK